MKQTFEIDYPREIDALELAGLIEDGLREFDSDPQFTVKKVKTK